MKVAAPELLARKTSLSDAGIGDDTREHDPQFELALAKLREQAQSSQSDEHGDDLASSHGDGLNRDRRRALDRLDADALSEDQVLSATANNPVLAALAATRTWQLPKAESAPTRADGLATTLAQGSVLEAVIARAGAAYMGAVVPEIADASANPSNVRQTAVSLTPDQVDQTVGTLTPSDARTPISADAANELVALSDATPDMDETVRALVSGSNQAQFAQPTAPTPATNAGATGANVPTLPAATAQRLIDGTVAALRIDRDTANPQHDASIIEVRHPELGIVKAEVRLIGDAMEVRFEASNPAAISLLRASESVLRKAVGQHGLRLRNLQIDPRSTLMQERSRRARRHLLDLEA